VRFAVYHLTSTANPEDDRVSIGARALTGDAYLGHVFWDTEIYLLPFYTAVWPEAARALLMYRFHTLPGARAKAAHFGFKGALYAWEPADTGVETTPERVVGAGREIIDILTGQMEHHISADVAYAVCSTGASPLTTISSFAPTRRSFWIRPDSGRRGLWRKRMVGGISAT
jgi:trehalose/maltose hydrolase-like predicted phosphorylase